MAESFAPSGTDITPNGLQITGEFFLTLSSESVPWPMLRITKEM